MKIKTNLIILFFLSFNFYGKSQIKLEGGFYCVKSNNHYRDNYFTNGKIVFYSDVYGRDFDSDVDFIKYVKSKYPFQIKKTKDGLYWGSGLVSNKYFYLVIIPKSLTLTFVSSPKDDKEFSDYSIFLLRQVRKNSGYYFTDYLGKSCVE